MPMKLKPGRIGATFIARRRRTRARDDGIDVDDRLDDATARRGEDEFFTRARDAHRSRTHDAVVEVRDDSRARDLRIESRARLTHARSFAFVRVRCLTARPNDELERVVHALAHDGVGCVVVVDGGRPIGVRRLIVSSRLGLGWTLFLGNERKRVATVRARATSTSRSYGGVDD